MVEILDETSLFPAVDRLRTRLQALLEKHSLEDRDVTVVIVDDVAMAERNLLDRGVEGPTDVLSYPTFEPDDLGIPEVSHLGDIFIDLEQAERQAPNHGHSTFDEVLVLAAHGLTHLRGFDHQTDEEWKPFLEAQKWVLADTQPK